MKRTSPVYVKPGAFMIVRSRKSAASVVSFTVHLNCGSKVCNWATKPETDVQEGWKMGMLTVQTSS